MSRGTANAIIWGTLVILLLIGFFAPVPSNIPPGLSAAGWLSGGLLSLGIFSAGLFSIGIFSAGLFSIGIFSVGTFAAGVWVTGQFIKRRPDIRD